MKTIAEVPAGKKLDAVVYDPATSRVFAFSGDSNSATAIQAADGKVLGTVDLGGGPEFAVADGSGYVYDNVKDASLVLKINSRSLKSNNAGRPRLVHRLPAWLWTGPIGVCSSAAAAK
ncbi:MAG: hypothetical protein ABSA80_00305 [Terriglobales bacterium]